MKSKEYKALMRLLKVNKTMSSADASYRVKIIKRMEMR